MRPLGSRHDMSPAGGREIAFAGPAPDVGPLRRAVRLTSYERVLGQPDRKRFMSAAKLPDPQERDDAIRLAFTHARCLPACVNADQLSRNHDRS